jgi:tetratricopeptide (TPR) repeat protein
MTLAQSVQRLALFPLWPLRAAAATFRRRPVVSTAAAVVLLLGGSLGGAFLWARAEEGAARRELKAGNYAEARRHVENCLTVRRRDVGVRLLAARVAWMEGDYPRAEAHLREATQLAGGSTEAIQLEWLLLKARAGEVDLVARGLWGLVEAGDPESPVILETMSKAYMTDLRLRPALGCLSKWLEMEPDNVTALDWRGWVLERLMNRDKAREQWERVLELQPDRWATRLRLVDLFLEDNNPKDARPHLDWLRKHQADRPEVLMAWGRYSVMQGEVSEAKGAFDRLLESGTDSPRLAYWRGKVELLPGGDPAVAEEWLRRAVAKDGSDVEAQYALYQSLEQQPGRAADAAAQKRHYEGVKADVERLDKLMADEFGQGSQDAGRCAEVGALMLRLGQESVGVRWLDMALTYDPNCKRAHQALADYFEKKGDGSNAEEHRRAAEGKP